MARVGVLLVDPDQTLVGGVRQALEGHPYELRLAGSTVHALEVIGTGDAEAVLVSLGAGDRERAAFITELAGRWPDVPVVAVTEPGGRAQGFQMLGAGAWDYLEPPGDLVPERLLTVLGGALERRRSPARASRARGGDPEPRGARAPGDPRRARVDALEQAGRRAPAGASPAHALRQDAEARDPSSAPAVTALRRLAGAQGVCHNERERRPPMRGRMCFAHSVRANGGGP